MPLKQARLRLPLQVVGRTPPSAAPSSKRTMPRAAAVTGGGADAPVRGAATQADNPARGGGYRWWGGPPRPRPAPWPAPCRWQVADSACEERVQGDPRGPGGPPHRFGSITDLGLI